VSRAMAIDVYSGDVHQQRITGQLFRRRQNRLSRLSVAASTSQRRSLPMADPSYSRITSSRATAQRTRASRPRPARWRCSSRTPPRSETAPTCAPASARADRGRPAGRNVVEPDERHLHSGVRDHERDAARPRTETLDHTAQCVCDGGAVDDIGQRQRRYTTRASAARWRDR